ncbi:MAG: hypothetical protein ACFFDH_07570 [Promethearchaeota archaeon]
MTNISFAALYQNAREKNVLAGIAIVDLIAFISYVIFPAGIFYLGDLQMIIGCIIGIIFTFKNIKSNQSYVKHGILVGLGGTILTAISYSIFDWIILSSIDGFNLSYFPIIFGFFLIEAIIIGIIIGLTIGGIMRIFNHSTHKNSREESIQEDEFYEGLIEK